MADKTAFDEKTRRKLEQVMLWSQRARAGAMKGERRSTKRGTSIEFADYRNYTRGDDLRRLDWNVYARLNRPYIKLLEDEEDLAVHIIVDSSASMNWPQDQLDANKFTFAQRLAAGLAYTSLTSNDRMLLTAINDRQTRSFGPARGHARRIEMLNFVDDLEPRGVTDLNVILSDYALRSRRPGLLFIISDMFSPTGYSEGIGALLGKGYEVVVLHLLAPDEVDPDLAGDLRLIDIETDSAQEVTVDAGMREIYMQRLAVWRDEMRKELLRKGGHYLFVETSAAWERIVLQDMRRLGLLK